MICAAIGPMVADCYEADYKPLRLVGCSRKTLAAYGTALNHWASFAGHCPIDNVDTRMMAEFQQHLLLHTKPASVNCYLRHILAILRFAKRRDSIAEIPDVRKLREPKRVPLALTTDEFSKVLLASEQWPGKIGGYRAGDWWRTLLLVAWESGLRYTALLSVRCVDVLFDSAGFYCQAEPQKDKEAQWFPLPPYILDAVRKLYVADRELLFPRTVTVETVGRWFRKILDKSGVYAPKGCGMRFHRIRKSKASYTKAAGLDATKALGHSGSIVTDRYYDPRIVGGQQPSFMPMPNMSPA